MEADKPQSWDSQCMWGFATPISLRSNENAATEQCDLMCDRRTYVVIWNIGHIDVVSVTQIKVNGLLTSQAEEL
jgi:hypothetical protein